LIVPLRRHKEPRGDEPHEEDCMVRTVGHVFESDAYACQTFVFEYSNKSSITYMSLSRGSQIRDYLQEQCKVLLLLCVHVSSGG
jgi:hypothetical protein